MIVTFSTRAAVLLTHAIVGWALCFATIAVGMAVTTPQTALIIHAVGAPILFGGISSIYFAKFGYTTPLRTAIFFTSFVMLADFFLVALAILRSLEMFASPLGTWIPFALIFASTWLTGSWRQSGHASATSRLPSTNDNRTEPGAGCRLKGR